LQIDRCYSPVLADSHVLKMFNSEIKNNVFNKRMIFNAYKYHALNGCQSKLNNFIKREECRNACLIAASVPEQFVKAVRELADIAHRLKSERENATNAILFE
jgi:hypothetical protein